MAHGEANWITKPQTAIVEFMTQLIYPSNDVNVKKIGRKISNII